MLSKSLLGSAALALAAFLPMPSSSSSPVAVDARHAQIETRVVVAESPQPRPVLPTVPELLVPLNEDAAPAVAMQPTTTTVPVEVEDTSPDQPRAFTDDDFDDLRALTLQHLADQHRPRFGENVVRWIPNLLANQTYDWPLEEALGIVACESNGDPSAVNPTSGTTGLMQIHPENLSGSNVHSALRPLREAHSELSSRRYATEWLKDPDNNLAAGYLIYARNRDVDQVPWREWACRNKVL